MPEGSPRDVTTPRRTAPRPRRAHPRESDQSAPPGDTTTAQAAKTPTDLAIEAAIATTVASAPPLSEETRARLAELLSVNHRARRR